MEVKCHYYICCYTAADGCLCF